MIDAPRTGIILVAAGSGTRLGSDVPKAFAPLAGRTILSHALERVLDALEPALVVVVVPAGRTEDARRIVEETAGPVLDHVRVVEGGATRQESVALGLRVLGAEAEIVLVHDAARALAPSRLVDEVAAAVRERGVGVVPALAMTDTVKEVEGESIAATVDRSALRAVQTPQGFPRAMIEDAYAMARGERTDDAALVAEAGHPVVVVPGSDDAFKITTPWDLRRAERALARPVRVLPARTGVGIDVHAYDAGRELRLACLDWPGEPGLAGHSDGDAVAHAVTDALLSAAGLGDIGGVFGTDDPRYEGASGEVFLRATVERLRDAGLGVVNVSVQVIGERPRLSRRREEAQERLSAILGAPVSVAGTTSDHLGFTGRGEGLCAIATALIAPLDQ